MRRTTALMNQWKLEEKSGENLTFEMCKGGYFSTKDDIGLRVVGNIDQELLTGKNLLDERRLSKQQTERGITSYWDESSKTVKIQGTNTDYWMRYLLHNNPSGSYSNVQPFEDLLEDGETYIMTVKGQGNFENLSILGVVNDKTTGNVVKYLDQTTSFTVDKTNYTYDWFRLQCSTVGAVLDCEVNVQLAKVSDGADYEPYCGGVPAPNVDYPKDVACVKEGTKITCYGKNLVDETRLKNSTSVGITSYWDETEKAIRVHGTNTGYFMLYLLYTNPPYTYRNLQSFDDVLIDGETYMMVFQKNGNLENLSAMGQRTRKTDGDVGYIAYNVPFTVDKTNYTYDWFRLQCSTVGAVLDGYVNLQLIRVINGDEYETYYGKNLLDERLLTTQTERGITSYWDAETNTIKLQGTNTDYYMRYFLNNNPGYADRNIQSFDDLLEDGKTYILLFQRYGEYKGLSAMGQRTRKTDGDVGYIAYNVPFTVDKTNYTYDWFRLQCSTAGTVLDCQFNLQLVNVQNGEAYETYMANDIVTPCDLYEGDIWYPMTGKVVHAKKKIVFDGTEDIIYRYYQPSEGVKYPRFHIHLSDAHIDANGRTDNQAFSNYFRTTNYNSIYVGKGGISLSNDSPRIAFNSPIGEGIYDYTVEEVSAWIQEKYNTGEPMYVIYELAEPWVEEFQPQSMFAYPKVSNILQTPVELSANLEAAMLVKKEV